MLAYSGLIFIINILVIGALIWNGAERKCPKICTCRLEHLTDAAIYRFINEPQPAPVLEHHAVEYNDVLYEEDNLEDTFKDNQIVRSAMCILHTETQPLDLIKQLPEDIEALTIIQGFNTGNKTIKFSYLENFHKLISLELLGPNLFNQRTNSPLLCIIDMPLNVKYLNLENILINNSKNQIQNFIKEFKEEEITFEYVQKFDVKVHPLTMVQQGVNDGEILPYEKYKKQDDSDSVPLFVGFKNLLLLRIKNCDLNNIYWAMFDGLNNLQYLILDKNNLRFIPAFAFYGTPNLKSLSLAHNNLLDIQLTDLAGLLELEYLDLSFNNFSQLSELSLPPFPKLKLANFANNPITVIFPNTFEVMNTTDSLVIGSDVEPLTLMPNSFTGLNLLKKITISNLKIDLLKKELFVGMPNLKEVIISGNITAIEYDTFVEVYRLGKLILNNCNLKNLSIDSFMGLDNLEYLDLSYNLLEYLPPKIFDQLTSLKELYLNNNKLQQLPRDIFHKSHAKLIRLNDNPWHCSCDMSEWKPMIINRIKQKVLKDCNYQYDKGVGCEHGFLFKYVYENKVAPKCSQPALYKNWSVFHVMRRLLKCPEYKPKLKKFTKKVKATLIEHPVEEKHPKIQISNDLNDMKIENVIKNWHKADFNFNKKLKKVKTFQNQPDFEMSNNIL